MLDIDKGLAQARKLHRTKNAEERMYVHAALIQADRDNMVEAFSLWTSAFGAAAETEFKIVLAVAMTDQPVLDPDCERCNPEGHKGCRCGRRCGLHRRPRPGNARYRFHSRVGRGPLERYVWTRVSGIGLPTIEIHPDVFWRYGHAREAKEG